MKLYSSKEATDSTAGFYLLLDNDFLSEIFRDEKVLSEFLTVFQNSYYLIDPLTEFEFLRDVFDPQQRSIKTAFISQPIPQSAGNIYETTR